jgi:hypothetical protein
MRAWTLRGLIVGTAFGLLFAMAAAQDAAPKKAQKNRYLGHVRHVVLLKFKDGTKEEDVKKVEDAFRALREKIPVVESLEWGTNVSPEKINQGFTHCFFLTFRTEKDRDTYLKHPEHKAFGGVLRPHVDKVLVVDFVAKE